MWSDVLVRWLSCWIAFTVVWKRIEIPYSVSPFFTLYVVDCDGAVDGLGVGRGVGAGVFDGFGVDEGLGVGDGSAAWLGEPAATSGVDAVGLGLAAAPTSAGADGPLNRPAARATNAATRRMPSPNCPSARPRGSEPTTGTRL